MVFDRKKADFQPKVKQNNERSHFNTQIDKGEI